MSTRQRRRALTEDREETQLQSCYSGAPDTGAQVGAENTKALPVEIADSKASSAAWVLPGSPAAACRGRKGIEHVICRAGTRVQGFGSCIRVEADARAAALNTKPMEGEKWRARWRQPSAGESELIIHIGLHVNGDRMPYFSRHIQERYSRFISRLMFQKTVTAEQQWPEHNSRIAPSPSRQKWVAAPTHVRN